ncbi:MAG: four helix bundle protein [Kofleriaceae bacterium]
MKNTSHDGETNKFHSPAENAILVARTPVKFVAYEVALELIGALAPVVEQIKRHSADLADQIVRAANSITLNLSEGSGRRGKDRKRFFLFAQGSAKEVRGALDSARAWGWRIEMGAAYALLDRELRLLWGLCR